MNLAKSQTDWERLRQLSDNEIDYSDIPPLEASFFREATLVSPKTKQSVTIRLDADIINWFKREGRGYQTRINTVLREHVQNQGQD